MKAWLLIPLMAALASAPPDLDARLSALHPEQPGAYFDLAEEVADAAGDDAQQLVLARELFARSAVLDTERYGRSACLALADLAPSGARQAQLLALAELLGAPRDACFGPRLRDAEGPPAPAVALAVIDAFALYRMGEGDQAATLLEDADVRDVFTRLAEPLPGGARRITEDFRLYPRAERTGKRPSLSDRVVSHMLLVEMSLHAAGDRPFASEVLLAGRRPLIEVDPARIAESLQVDAERPIWRNGGWVPLSVDPVPTREVE